MAWVPTGDYEYTIGVRPMPTRRITTSTTELTHLLIAYIVLSVDIAIILESVPLIVGYGIVNVSGIGTRLAIGAVAALTGFIAHEMAHKVVAQRYGFWAEFRMSPFGLILSFMTSLFGFLFAAPGATVVGGMGDVREWGRTSLAGPALNFLEGGVFFVAGMGALFAHAPGAWVGALLLVAFFNAWFAAFNLLPLGPLDGRKVWRWNQQVWVASFAVAIGFAAVLYWLTMVYPTLI